MWRLHSSCSCHDYRSLYVCYSSIQSASLRPMVLLLRFSCTEVKSTCAARHNVVSARAFEMSAQDSNHTPRTLCIPFINFLSRAMLERASTIPACLDGSSLVRIIVVQSLRIWSMILGSCSKSDYSKMSVCPEAARIESKFITLIGCKSALNIST